MKGWRNDGWWGWKWWANGLIKRWIGKKLCVTLNDYTVQRNRCEIKIYRMINTIAYVLHRQANVWPVISLVTGHFPPPVICLPLTCFPLFATPVKSPLQACVYVAYTTVALTTRERKIQLVVKIVFTEYNTTSFVNQRRATFSLNIAVYIFLEGEWLLT